MKKDVLFKLAKIAGLSLLLFLVTCWPAGYQFADFTLLEGFAMASWVEGIAFLFFTAWCCRKFKLPQISYSMIVGAIIIGSFICELPVRIFSFEDSLVSMGVPVIRLAAILLGYLCFKTGRKEVWAICVAVILVYAYLVPNSWSHHVYVELKKEGKIPNVIIK